jgi:flavin reductase (DIM6/NTAB) family NADH-FMN oxidoreductase RutF
MVEPGPMRHALAGFATGLAAVAAEIDGEIIGMPVNSLQSVSLEPPLVSLSFAHTSTTWPRLRLAPRWGISVLSEQMGAAAQDLRRPAGQRFSGLPVKVRDGAAFIEDALVRISVAPRSEVMAGDHTLVILDVLALDRDDAHDPLIFFGGRVRTLAQ